MSTKSMIGIGLAALLLVTFAFAVAPKAPAAAPAAVKIVAASQAYAEEAAPAEGAAAEAKGEGEKKEIPHTTGTLTEEQKADLNAAWENVPGFNLLIVSILSLIVIMGIVGFGAFKQARV
jgi:hypothetical protein